MADTQNQKLYSPDDIPDINQPKKEFININMNTQSNAGRKNINANNKNQQYNFKIIILILVVIILFEGLYYLLTPPTKQNNIDLPINTISSQFNEVKENKNQSVNRSDIKLLREQVKAQLFQLQNQLTKTQTLTAQVMQKINQREKKINQIQNQADLQADNYIQLGEILKDVQYKSQQNLKKIEENLQILTTLNKQMLSLKQTTANTKIQGIDVKQQSNLQLIDSSLLPIIRTQNEPASEKFKFKIPKIVWLFLDRSESDENYFTQRCIQNVRWYTRKSGFQLRIVGKYDYNKWLSKQKSSQLQKIIAELQPLRKQSQQLNSYFQNMRQSLIKLMLVRQFGGVCIRKMYIFTQELDWLQDIKNNLVVNTGNSYAKPNFFGLISMQNSPMVKRENKQAKIQVQKHVIKLPAIKQYFYAAYPQSNFIIDLFEQYIQLIKNCKDKNQFLKQFLFPNKIDTSLYRSFTLASQIVLIKKQKQFDLKGQLVEGKYTKFAIDQYGLFTINSNLYPDKMEFLFTDKLPENCFNFAAILPQDQFQYTIGPLRYLANSNPLDYFQSRIMNAIDGTEQYAIIEGSFIHRHLFMDKKYSFIRPNIEKTEKTNINFKKWQNLPKIVWIIWDKGFQNSQIQNKLSVINIQKNALAAGFKINRVTNENIHQYLDQNQLARIAETISEAKIVVNKQTRADLYRIALVSKYGGIYLDSSFFFLQDLSWITNIANQNPKQIFNRFGDVPKAMLQFHPFVGGMFNWTIDTKANTKVNWHLAYENNFIIAEPNSEFMKDWYDMQHLFIKSDYPKMQAKMIECNTFSHKWSNPTFRYLTCMDSLKAAVGCRQQDIKANPDKYKGIVNANDYYKLWAINGFTGIQKFRHYNEYGLSYENRWEKYLFLTNYPISVSKQVIGEPFKAIKFYGGKIDKLHKLIVNEWKQNFKNEVHPDSYFTKYLFNSEELQFYQNNTKLQVRKKIK